MHAVGMGGWVVGCCVLLLLAAWYSGSCLRDMVWVGLPRTRTLYPIVNVFDMRERKRLCVLLSIVVF